MKRGEMIYSEKFYWGPSMLILSRDRIGMIREPKQWRIQYPVSVKLIFNTASRHDLDKYIRGALDFLKEREVIIDDNWVDNVEATKKYVKSDFEDFTIEVYQWVKEEGEQ